MSTHKNIDKICVAVIAISLLLTLLFMNGASFGLETLVDEDAETYTGSSYFTRNDRNGTWNTEGAASILLEGTDGSISGSGAYFYDGNLVIASAGSYVISGELTDGSIVVDAYDSSKVWILLDGVTITCPDDACIRVEQADKVFLTLAEESENVLESGAEYSDVALADGTDGAIFSHDDLTINGSGSLTVDAGYKHGIACNDGLVIAGGTIRVTAVKDAIRANDSLCIAEAQIQVNAEDDGIVTAEEGSYLYMESGSLEVMAADDGIHTAGDIIILDGTITVDAGDDGIHSDTRVDIGGGTVMIGKCYEGIEAPQIDISGGDITIYPTDDGLNANGGSSEWGFFGGMNGGGMPVGEMPDGGMAEGEMPVGEMPDGGMAEGEMPVDDILGGGWGNPPMREQMQQDDVEHDGTVSGEMETGAEQNRELISGEDDLPCIRISGGSLTVINSSGMDADGIDSNGDIIITGGTILISLNDTGMNNAIDYGSENGGSCRIDGGTVIACGGSSMVEDISPESTQCSILYMLQEAAEAGTALSLKDADGTVLLEQVLPCSFSSAIVSCPELQLNETYEIFAGDLSETVVLEEVAASAGSSFAGFPAGGMMGGMMDRGQRNQDQGGNMSGMQGNHLEKEEEAESYSSQVSVSDLDSDTWPMMGASTAVLGLGILAAAGYRRRR